MSFAAVFASISLGVLVTSFISGILGMAGGMILMGILLAFLPVAAAMMLHGITQFASNGWRAWLWRANVDWRVFRGYAYGLAAALTLFLMVQFIVGKAISYVILGLTPFVTYLLPQRMTLDVDRRGQPFACGFICTALQLVAGVSGPLLDVFFVRSAMDRRGVVATKAMSQTLGHLTKIFYFGGVALFTSQSARADIGNSLSVPLAAACVILAFTGTSLSKRVLEAMSDANFRQWTKWTVLVTGTVYLGYGLWLLRTSGG